MAVCANSGDHNDNDDCDFVHNEHDNDDCDFVHNHKEHDNNDCAGCGGTGAGVGIGE